MKKNRMFEAVSIPKNPWIGCLYAILACIIVVFILNVGSLLGNFIVNLLFVTPIGPSILYAMYYVDPLLLSLLSFGFPALMMILWVLAVERRSPKGLGFYGQSAWKELLKGLLVGFVLIASVVGLLYVTGSIEVTTVDFSSLNILNFLIILPFWFLQSGTEEMLTRGWLLPVVARKTRPWIGVAASSLLFAFLHVNNPSVTWISLLNIALFGLLASLYVLKTDNIWGVSAIHAAWNAFQGSFFGLNVSGLSTAYAPMRFQENVSMPEQLTGGEFGPEGSLLASLVMVVYILYLVWDLFYRPKRVDCQAPDKMDS